MSEWDKRQLCPDGACTGVIGADGKCKVCGKAGTSKGGASDLGPRTSASEDEEDDDDLDDEDDDDYEGDDGDDYDDEDDEDDDEDDEVPAEARGPTSGAPSSDWANRKLCPDGACTGVIGDNGKCKVCGRSAA